MCHNNKGKELNKSHSSQAFLWISKYSIGSWADCVKLFEWVGEGFSQDVIAELGEGIFQVKKEEMASEQKDCNAGAGHWS